MLLDEQLSNEKEDESTGQRDSDRSREERAKERESKKIINQSSKYESAEDGERYEENASAKKMCVKVLRKKRNLIMN